MVEKMLELVPRDAGPLRQITKYLVRIFPFVLLSRQKCIEFFVMENNASYFLIVMLIRQVEGLFKESETCCV